MHSALVGAAVAAQVISDIAEISDAHRANLAVEASEAEDEGPPPDPIIVVAPPPPIGFYCARATSSIDISLCTRAREACVAAVDAASLAVPDLESCRAEETAWCFAGRCYANQASCERRRGPDSIGACEEIH